MPPRARGLPRTDLARGSRAGRSLIAVTSSRELQALGTGGQLAIEAAAALSALLARELTSDHAALFAEPHRNEARGEVDWYAEGKGPAVPLAEVSPDAARTARAILDRLTDDIRELAGRLRAAPGESDRFLGEMLELALRLPDQGAIRVRDGRPVLVGWGHVRIGPQAAMGPVLGRVRAAPVPMAILPPPRLPEPAGPALWPWLAALGVSFLLLVPSVWLLLHPPRGEDPRACRLDETDLAALRAWREANDRNAALRAQLAALADDAGRRRLQCRPPEPPARPVQPPPSPDAQRAEQRGAHTGRLQIILAWDDRNDLDLHVICPDNQHLYFQHRRACGGELDLDANADPRRLTATPAEHAFWADPPQGTYKVIVDPYGMRDGTRSAFRVTVRQEGRPDQTQEGIAIAGQRVAPVLEVQVPPP